MVWILGLGSGGLYHKQDNCGNMANSKKKRRDIPKHRAEALLLLPCKRCYGDKPRPPTRHRYEAPRPGPLQQRILRYLDTHPVGGSYDEIAAALGYERDPVRRKTPAAVVRALKRLEERGMVTRHVTRSPNGHRCYLWVPAGIDVPIDAAEVIQ